MYRPLKKSIENYMLKFLVHIYLKKKKKKYVRIKMNLKIAILNHLKGNWFSKHPFWNILNYRVFMKVSHNVHFKQKNSNLIIS